MHCTACVMRLEGLEDDLVGVKHVKASYIKQTMQVEFDEAKISPEKIIQAVKEKGYQASLID
jgi:copper chaperone CopZ